jgi:pilus assembly protein CpaB
MNTQRILVLAGAGIAALAAAFLVRYLLGGGTPKVVAALPPPVTTSEVLVAAADLAPGAQLTPESVRWQQWPKRSVDSSFITHDATPDLGKVVTGAVVRAPMVSGEPLSTSKIVEHAQGVGYMAAVVTPGMRALAIPITTETGAGGFILPNDRVDVLSTLLISDSPRRFRSRTLLTDIRVLAVDQTYEGKEQKTVLAKTATLELSPDQVETIETAQASGTLSLALRALGQANAPETASSKSAHGRGDANVVSVYRYGLERPTTFGQRE